MIVFLCRGWMACRFGQDKLTVQEYGITDMNKSGKVCCEFNCRPRTAEMRGIVRSGRWTGWTTIVSLGGRKSCAAPQMELLARSHLHLIIESRYLVPSGLMHPRSGPIITKLFDKAATNPHLYHLGLAPSLQSLPQSSERYW